MAIPLLLSLGVVAWGTVQVLGTLIMFHSVMECAEGARRNWGSAGAHRQRVLE